MTIFSNFLNALVMTTGLGIFVVFAIQNVIPTSLKFFLFESIQLPISILLTFCFAMGLLLGALLPIFWQRPKKKRTRFEDLEEEFDFD